MKQRRRKQYVSRLRLVKAGLLRHFRRAPALLNQDAFWLDSRQFKRFKRAEAKRRNSLT